MAISWPTSARSRRGFTLLELIIVVAILGILLGAAVPVASMVFKSKARRATREELEELSGAAAEYFRDTFALPTAPMDLNVDPGVAGWSGPYMLTATVDPIIGITDSALDAWSRPFRFTASGPSTLILASAGEDAQFGTAADMELTLDVTPIRRAVTLDELEIVNQAVSLHNAQYLPDDPLPVSYSQLLNELVQKGFLPSGNAYATDGWGDGYVPVPVGRIPVVEVGSIHLPHAGSAGGSGQGSGNNGNNGSGGNGNNGNHGNGNNGNNGNHGSGNNGHGNGGD